MPDWPWQWAIGGVCHFSVTVPNITDSLRNMSQQNTGLRPKAEVGRSMSGNCVPKQVRIIGSTVWLAAPWRHPFKALYSSAPARDRHHHVRGSGCPTYNVDVSRPNITKAPAMANDSGFPISRHDTESGRWTTIPFRNQMANHVALSATSVVVSAFALFTQEGIKVVGLFDAVSVATAACG